MQYAVEAALREFIEAPGALSASALELVLKRNELAIVKADDAVKLADVEEATGKAFVNGMNALVAEAQGEAVRMRVGVGEPVKAISISDLEALVDDMVE